MRKIFVLDTNVLIHDPNSLYSFEENIVVIPIYVIEELDKLKKHHDEKGRNAREVTRQINKIKQNCSLSEGCQLPKGGIIKIILENGIEDTRGLKKDHPDNKIIFTALNLKKQQNEMEVIFVSKDLNARLKADALGIKSEDYEKSKVKIDELYMGWMEIEVKASLIQKFYDDRELKIDLNKIEQAKEFYNNEYVLAKSEANEKSSFIGRYDKNRELIVPLINDNPHVWGVKALNVQQRFAFDALLRKDIHVVTLLGQAGTGKTLLAIASGLQMALDNMVYSKVLVARPVIPMGKDIGYLPGSKDEKLHYWMQPIFDNLRFIFSTGGSTHKNPEEEINYLMKLGKIELEALTYIRGRSIPGQYVIIDEAQNLSPHEVKTIISRAGEGTKIVLTGDPYQIDNPYLDSESNGLTHVVEHFKDQEIFAHITFVKSERSKLAAIAADLL